MPLPLAIGTLGNVEMLVILVLFSPIVFCLGLTAWFVFRARRNKPQPPPPLPREPGE